MGGETSNKTLWNINLTNRECVIQIWLLNNINDQNFSYKEEQQNIRTLRNLLYKEQLKQLNMIPL